MKSIISNLKRKMAAPLALALVGGMLVAAAPAAADDDRYENRHDRYEGRYDDGHYTATRKFGRGFAGMTTSFLELPGNMVLETHRHGAAEGIPLGFFKGLGMIVVRTPVGVYETVTAPFPAPEGYRPIIRPEYPWSYFDHDHDRAELDRPYDRTARR